MWLLAIWLCLTPWFFVPGSVDSFIAPRQMCFDLSGWGIVVWALFHQVPRARWENPWLKWVLVWGLFRWLLDFWKPFLLSPSTPDTLLFNWYTLVPFSEVLLCCLLVYVLVTMIFTNQPHRIQQVTMWVCYSSTLLAAYSLLQMCGFDEFFNQKGMWRLSETVGSNAMIGTMGNVSYASTYLGLTVPLFLLFQEKRFLLFLGIVISALFGMHKSYGFLGAFIGLSVYAWSRSYYRFPQWKALVRVVGIGGLSLAVGAGWTFRHALTSNPRWTFWHLVIKMLHQHTLTGFGIGSFVNTFFINWEHNAPLMGWSPGSSKWLWAHNDLLQWMYEYGVIGGVLVLLVLYRALKNGWKNSSTPIGAGYFACAMSLCAVSLMNFPWHFAPSVSVALVIWAMNEVRQQEGVS